MHVHLIGVCGTGMGALASLMVEAGHQVTGSDSQFKPPISPLLEQLGVATFTGWSAANLEAAALAVGAATGARPDLVVVGNVCRRDNPEARAAIDGGLQTTSLPQAIADYFLDGRASYVVAGTHGKTTTTTLVHHLLRETGFAAGLFVGGVPIATGRSAQAGQNTAPFVLEGDEYDSAFFDKTPKFWKYQPYGAILTSIEHDHIDIYPDPESYIDAFRRFIQLIPKDGVLVAWAGDPLVRQLAEEAECRVSFYALDSDDCDAAAPVWLAAPAPNGAFDLFVGGSFGGRLRTPLIGHHNLRNGLAALALCAEAAGAPLDRLSASLSGFEGVQRRQELVGQTRGISVYDDFAHHPTAVAATLAGFAERFPSRRIVAVFEPRSATASRQMHQEQYKTAFASAKSAYLAPVGRPEIAEDERLDTRAIAEALRASGIDAHATDSHDEVVEQVARTAQDGDIIVCMSNGAFGQVPDRILAALATRAA